MTKTRTKRAWRFQPVYAVFDEDRVYSLCRVYVMPDDTLDSWSEDAAIVPQGNDIEDLTGEMSRMIVDAWRWEPVAFADLKVGMSFQRRISPEQAEALARMVETTCHNFREAGRG